VYPPCGRDTGSMVCLLEQLSALSGIHLTGDFEQKSRAPGSSADFVPEAFIPWRASGPQNCARAGAAEASNASPSRLFVILDIEPQKQAWLMIPVMFSLAVPFMVSVSFAVPVVIVFNTAAISFPVTHKKLLPIMMRLNPTSSLVRWSSPITVMPPIMPSRGIPITPYPHELRTWRCWQNLNHTGRRRRPNSDSNRNLRADYRRRGQ
jgi:hypothetical protein